MTFFESLLVLLLAATVLLQVARRFALPYPANAGGTLVAMIPGSPNIRIEPETALALFIAPALADAAFDFPVGAAMQFWRPLVSSPAASSACVARSVGRFSLRRPHLGEQQHRVGRRQHRPYARFVRLVDRRMRQNPHRRRGGA